ncbi:MAG: xylan 1,4-beta-xylosidase [Lachnospiraceae bacterium]
MERQYQVSKGTTVPFHNAVDFCIGTGRMGLALQKEYFEQLRYVQENIGFSYIRGHGLFCDDMAIYQSYEDKDGIRHTEYNFTYLDRVMDSYLSLNIRPFLELGFMPKKLASGEQTVFYWKGNVTPPKDYSAWVALVQATLKHLMERYGRKEVLTWPIEVWNEPNLRTFWKDADMPEYFKLYKITSEAVKAVDSELQVGGPAICGVEDELWLRSFLEFVRESHAPLDFITRHHYTSNVPQWDGHYGYIGLHEPEYAFGELERSRKIVDSFPEFRGMDIHITEFNTSYIPECPIHDTNLNAAYVAHMLSRLGDCHASYSYWTFGDVFEEGGVAFTPFSGGFGLVANGIIPKPTFWTFAFYKKLQGECIHRSDEAVVVRTENGAYRGVIWNADGRNTGEELNLLLELPADKDIPYCLAVKTVDEECCNPLKVWHDLGEPANPSKEALELLREAAKPLVTTERISAENGNVRLALRLKKNAVKYFELTPAVIKSDSGYSYERTLQQKIED